MSSMFRPPPERRSRSRRTPRARSDLFTAVLRCQRCGGEHAYDGELGVVVTTGCCHYPDCGAILPWFAVLSAAAARSFHLVAAAPVELPDPRESVEWAAAQLRSQRAGALKSNRYAVLLGCSSCGELVCLPGDGDAEVEAGACARCERAGARFRLASEASVPHLRRTNADRIRGYELARERPDLRVMPDEEATP